jgi:hypothetical protein
MGVVIDLNREPRPLERLKEEQAEVKEEYVFTVEEGEKLARILRDALPLFKRFYGCPRTPSLEKSVATTLVYVEFCARRALDRQDFALVPIWDGSKLTLDAVKL